MVLVITIIILVYTCRLLCFLGQALSLCFWLPQLKQPVWLWWQGWSGRAQRPHEEQCCHAGERERKKAE